MTTNEITITQLSRGGYSFTLPVSPCKPALAKLKQLCPGYDRGTRWVSDANLPELCETLKYWLTETPIHNFINRQGQQALTVKVAMVADDPENMYELMRIWR